MDIKYLILILYFSVLTKRFAKKKKKTYYNVKQSTQQDEQDNSITIAEWCDWPVTSIPESCLISWKLTI